MTTTTPNLSLTLYNSTTDGTALFSNFRAAIAGDGVGSNFYKIDTAYGVQANQILALQDFKGAILVPCVYTSANYYVATGITGIDGYTTGMSIIVKLDTTSDGTVTLNINSLGTKSLMKVNSSGGAINIEGSELSINRYYLFTYNGSAWIWVDAATASNIYVGGTSGNFVRVSSGNILEDSGSSPSTFAPAANGVTNGDSHDHSGGDGGQIDYNGLANLPIIIPSTGWVEVGDTWTYASATTITVPTDATTTYQAGTKIRWKQGGSYKYGIVRSLTSVLLTIAPTTDYTLTNATITDVAYSFIENPFGFPEWFNYLPDYPTYNSMSFSTVTTTLAKYCCKGKTATLVINASGTTGGTAGDAIAVSLPFTSGTGDQRSLAEIRDATSGVTAVGVGVVSDRFYFSKLDNTNFGLGTGRRIRGTVTYLIL